MIVETATKAAAAVGRGHQDTAVLDGSTKLTPTPRVATTGSGNGKSAILAETGGRNEAGIGTEGRGETGEKTKKGRRGATEICSKTEVDEVDGNAKALAAGPSRRGRGAHPRRQRKRSPRRTSLTLYPFLSASDG